MTQKPEHPATTLFHKVRSRLENLADRWADEREYEDINDYAKPFQEDIKAAGATFAGMSKRPFGFRAIFGDTTVLYYASSSTVGFKPLKR